jgi:molecular chaperone DnaK (HSP70)
MSAGKTGLKAEDRKAIGITLGNSNSSIAYLKEDNVEVIANEDGGRRELWEPIGGNRVLQADTEVNRQTDPHRSLIRRRR